MPRCLRHIRVGAGEEQSPVAVMRARRPHLLAVDDPLVAVAHRSSAQTGEVGAGAGLGEQLAPDLVAVQHRRQEPLLLLVAPPRDDRRARHPDADREHTDRDVEARLLLVEDALLPAGPAPAARTPWAT